MKAASEPGQKIADFVQKKSTPGLRPGRQPPLYELGIRPE